MFQLMDNKQGIATAFQQIKNNLEEAATVYKNHKVGWQGGSRELDVYWNRRLGFWCHFGGRKDLNRYWCLFGVDDPQQHQMLSITVEINPPRSGVNNRVAGAFVQGPDGHVYLAHSGKVGGGTEGVGKSAFLNFCRGANWQMCRSTKGAQTWRIILGRIDSPRLKVEVAGFTHEVARFKARVRASVAAGEPITSSTEIGLGFSPEFSGKRTPYPLGGEVEAECLHGPIVNSLAAFLSLRKFEIDNDQQRDLFVRLNGAVSMLFEVKTNLSTTCIYGGIGQLMLHTALEKTAPRRILVLPGEPEEGIAAAVKKLGIELLQYSWKNNQAKFIDIDRVLDNHVN